MSKTKAEAARRLKPAIPDIAYGLNKINKVLSKVTPSLCEPTLTSLPLRVIWISRLAGNHPKSSRVL